MQQPLTGGAQGYLTKKDDLLLYGSWIVVPAGMQQMTLTKLYEGHLRIKRWRLQARVSVWWPGISKQIEKMVHNCLHCEKNLARTTHPYITTQLSMVENWISPFHAKWNHIFDSLWLLFEISWGDTFTSASVISALKPIFVGYGIPEELVSDNGPQYAPQEVSDFAKEYNFQHTTSSQHFPQSNGHAQRVVQTVKKLLKGSKDPHMALLSTCIIE